jgi:FAD:protein FMN transferase
MELARETRKLLGTVVEIKAPVRHSPLFPICFSEIERIEKAYSRFLDSSELSHLNANLGKWRPASDEMLGLLLKAGEFRKRTSASFDITVKETLDALGYDKDYSFKPNGAKKKNSLLHFVAGAISGNVVVDAREKRVMLHKQIDFGGFGKGYALDCVAKLLDANGCGHYYINAGGDIFAKRGEGMPPWEILLEHPDDSERAIGKIEIDNCSIAGSAPNRRKWGNGLHHLINAKTGKPATGVKAIFVVAKTGMEADAYSTAIFTSGFEEGIELSKKLPVQILMVSSENKMYQSPGFNAELFG